jgi:hypothetical protein
MCFIFPLSIREQLPIAIAIATAHDQYKIYQGPDTTTAQGQQLHHTNGIFTNIETMNTQSTQEEAQQQGSQPISLTTIGIRDNTSAMGT